MFTISYIIILSDTCLLPLNKPDASLDYVRVILTQGIDIDPSVKPCLESLFSLVTPESSARGVTCPNIPAQTLRHLVREV